MSRGLAVGSVSLLTVLVGGCGTQHSIGTVLGPGDRATAVVQGMRPRVEVATGPAPVHVTVHGKPVEEKDVQGVAAWTLRGDTEIQLENRGKEPAQVQVRTYDATGLSLERGK